MTSLALRQPKNFVGYDERSEPSIQCFRIHGTRNI